MIRFSTLLLVIGLQTYCWSADSDSVSRMVSSWPWEGHRAEVVSPDSEGVLVVSIQYMKEGIVSDMDQYGIRLHKNGDGKTFTVWGKGTSRCGNGGGCSGVARMENISKDGFDIAFNLQWTLKQKGKGEFKKAFRCQWKSTQKCEEDGFDIEVTISKNKKSNEPVDLIPVPSGLSAYLLLIPLRRQKECRKQPGIGHWGRSQRIAD